MTDEELKAIEARRVVEPSDVDALIAEERRLQADRNRYTRELDDYMRTIAAEQRERARAEKAEAEVRRLKEACRKVAADTGCCPLCDEHDCGCYA